MAHGQTRETMPRAHQVSIRPKGLQQKRRKQCLPSKVVVSCRSKVWTERYAVKTPSRQETTRTHRRIKSTDTMNPLYDQRCVLVGWFNGDHVFDTDLNWVAFRSGNNVFSSSSMAWLGPINDASFQDRYGKPIVWLAGASPSGTLRPLSPMRPLKPLNPLRPLRPLNPFQPLQPLAPLGGWSSLNWQQWLG